MKLLVLHGPNLNLFGRREPHIYGTTTLAEIDAKLQALAAELGAELECFQSNHEGALIDKLHERIDTVQGALVNPAGLTQQEEFYARRFLGTTSFNAWSKRAGDSARRPAGQTRQSS